MWPHKTKKKMKKSHFLKIAGQKCDTNGENGENVNIWPFI